jgi:hypothetical protein
MLKPTLAPISNLVIEGIVHAVIVPEGWARIGGVGELGGPR